MKPDLHTHTTSSDGLLTPSELVALADKHRVTLLAVTDHDTFDGAAQLLGKPAPMPILQGVELSLRDMACTCSATGAGRIRPCTARFGRCPKCGSDARGRWWRS